ncbi:hypothetical protein [Parerythrobacter jejuensis]|uniref:DUF600 family protein n=1 Tax=Parerythrobacter jejuensis TaxID=795812 RepID=A0A845ARH0_9SPHN|nr:hypothetical protein [Parerythrobacter jejuensis]MXP31987.1 hypothetical protein [Parerythrobacter jejuensis]
MDLDRAAELYNEVGAAAVEQIGTVDTKILVYAESDEGDLEILVRYSDKDAEVVDSLSDTEPVIEAVVDLYAYLEQAGEKHAWKCMEYVVDYGQVNVDISYDEAFCNGEELWEKSPKLLEKHFPGKPHR